MTEPRMVLLSSEEDRALERAVEYGLYETEQHALRAGIEHVRQQVEGYELYLNQIVVPAAEKLNQNPDQALSMEQLDAYLEEGRRQRRTRAA